MSEDTVLNIGAPAASDGLNAEIAKLKADARRMSHRLALYNALFVGTIAVCSFGLWGHFESRPITGVYLAYVGFCAAIAGYVSGIRDSLRSSRRERGSATEYQSAAKASSPYLIGAGTLLDLRGAKANPYRGKRGHSADRQAIRTDWERVGEEIQSVMDKTEKPGPLTVSG